MSAVQYPLSVDPPIEWQNVRRVLVVRLRSIGDTVLATPSLIALKRFLPDAQIDILLEDWVAPVLDGFDHVDNVITVGKGSADRIRVARRLRREGYDLAFNLHGGTTATFLTFATGARRRVGYKGYRYSFLYTDLLSSSSEFWGREKTHSAEQQLALLGHVGILVDDRPRTRLAVTESAVRSLEEKLAGNSAFSIQHSPFALLHPAAAFATKQWPTENFARIAEHLAARGITPIAVVAKHEIETLEKLRQTSAVPIIGFNDLSLPEITALASKAKVFVGNDSGVAHMAAAVGTPTVVIFGSSNRDHWHPWTDAPNRIVYSTKPCTHETIAPVAGSEDPLCIRCVGVEEVVEAIEQVLK